MSEYNATFANFNGSTTLIAEYEHWCVLVRPKQVTLGSLVLVAKSDATAFSALPPAAFAEMETVIADIEATLAAEFQYDKINYLMLMMVDPHVHFHVIPRYAEPRTLEKWTLADEGWPGQPNLGSGSADEALVALMIDTLKAAWG
jgi:diadenosine tetraphosphate (Ap4A) HIT family hydrolase